MMQLTFGIVGEALFGVAVDAHTRRVDDAFELFAEFRPAPGVRTRANSSGHIRPIDPDAVRAVAAAFAALR